MWEVLQPHPVFELTVVTFLDFFYNYSLPNFDAQVSDLQGKNVHDLLLRALRSKSIVHKTTIK